MWGRTTSLSISLVQQPAELEEAVGDARMVKSRDEEDMSGRVVERVQHAFSFSPPKRDRKLSDEEQQEAKRPKSPAKEDVQQVEQHGSGGEGGEKMEIERPQFSWEIETEEQLDKYVHAICIRST